jgi:phospholipase/carboxylesterase
MSNYLPLVEIEPDTTAQYSMIWLHGLGADGHDFVSFVPELQLPSEFAMRFIFPHAPIIPVTLNGGYEMRAWFDVFGLSLQERIDEEGIAQSMVQIEKLIQREVEKGIPTENIFLGGFSQGCAMALATGLFHDKPLAGILGLSGFFPPHKLQDASLANKQTPIFLAHGTQDPVVPYELGEMTNTMLTSAGYPVTWRTYPIVHTVCKEEIDEISQWLQKVMKEKK